MLFQAGIVTLFCMFVVGCTGAGHLDGNEDPGPGDGASDDSSRMGDPGESEYPPSPCADTPPGYQPPINVVTNVHHDPVGVRGATNQAQRVSQYAGHREAFLWLRNLADEKGFTISSMLTGVYAEFVVRQQHFADFADFMPGGRHLLGVHLHAHYKGPGDTDPHVWSESYAPQHGQKTWNDQIPFVNAVFSNLGFGASDNHAFHGYHNTCPSVGECYGLQPNNNSYDNFFDIVGGRRGLYHPYRKGLGASLEDPTSPFIAVPLPSGVFGFDQVHGPEGMVYGTLGYVQRDFVLEYLERWYYQRYQLHPRPWVFGWGVHPYQMAPNAVGTDGRLVRDTLAEYFTWINDHFDHEVATYGHYEDTRRQFLEWEECNPQMYPTAEAPSDPVSLYGQSFHDALLDLEDSEDTDRANDHPFYLTQLEVVAEELIAQFANDLGERALLYIPGGTALLDVQTYFPGSALLRVATSGELPVAIATDDIEVSPYTPVLVLTPGFARNH